MSASMSAVEAMFALVADVYLIVSCKLYRLSVRVAVSAILCSSNMAPASRSFGGAAQAPTFGSGATTHFFGLEDLQDLHMSGYGIYTGSVSDDVLS